MTVVVDEAALGGFDAQPGGPALAAAVEFVDPTTLVGQDTAAWMRGAFRVRNHADWLLLRALREACRARADTTVRVEDEFAPRIAAANLGWSTTTAGTRLEIAVGILERMPALGERMRSGELELAKAGAFVTGLDGLTDAQCAQVVAGLLDQAPELPLGQLRDRILSAGYAVDRVWGANRLAAATARARVTRETAPSGAVNVCGRDLDPGLAADAAARLRALALAVRARLRAAGAKVALGFIEARVFIRLMDGTQAGATDTAVIAAVTAELMNSGESNPGSNNPGPDSSGPDGSDPDDSDPDGSGPDDAALTTPGPMGPAQTAPDPTAPAGRASGPRSGCPRSRQRRSPRRQVRQRLRRLPRRRGQRQSGQRRPRRRRRQRRTPRRGAEDDGRDSGEDDGPSGIAPRDEPDHGPAPTVAAPTVAPTTPGAHAATALPRTTRATSRTTLTPMPQPARTVQPRPTPRPPPAAPPKTLPPRRAVGGLRPRGGAASAALDTARARRPTRHPARHRTRPRRNRPRRRPRLRRGHLAAPRPRPPRPPPAPARAARPTRNPPRPATPPPERQLTAPAELLHALAARPDTDPAETRLPGSRNLLLDEATTTWLRHARDALVRSQTADPDQHPATTTRDRDRRFPGAALARWVAARDQTCIAPGCNRPAEACDLDHTIDWHHGGPTEAGDLDLLCRHDHRAKHQGGWHYDQPTPGVFVITDPTGTRHHVESRVVHPLPAPYHPSHGISPDPGHAPPRPDWAPNRTRDGRLTNEARATTEHLTRRARAQEGQPPSRYDTDPDF